MRIAVNTRFLLKDKLEGIGWFTYETLKRITKAHPEHQFIFFFDRPYDERFIFSANITPVVLFPPARHPILFYWWFDWSVTRALKKYKADIFLSTDGFLSLRTDVKTLLVVHDISFKHFPNQVKRVESWYYDFFMQRFMNKATRIATVSTYSKQDIIQHYAIDAHKIDVVYDGANPNFKPIDLKEQAKIKNEYTNGQDYFVYVGSMHPRKNIPRLIEAFDAFKKQTNAPLKLVLVGRLAWKTGEIQTTYNKSTYKTDIVFVDYVPSSQLYKIIASAYAMVYVSLFEGFGIPLLESLYCDVPVISSNTSSMPEVVGDAGILIDPYSIASITGGMIRIWKDKTLRNQLIIKGKIQRQRYSWDKTAEKLYNSIEKILSH